MTSDHFPDDAQPTGGARSSGVFEGGSPGASGGEARFSGGDGSHGLARLWTVVTRPRETFEASALRPQPWVALVALLLVVGVGSAMIAHIAGPEQMEMMSHSTLGKKMAENPDFPQKLEDARHPSPAKRGLTAVSGGVGAVVMVFLASFFYWLACLAVGGRQGFLRTLDVVALSTWVGSGLGFLATVPLIFAKGSVMTVSYSLAPLLGLFGGSVDPNSFVFRFLQTFTNGFAIWQLVVMALGFAVVHRISRGRAWTAALVPWVLGYALSLAIASLTL